jgi:hypothetical protein
MLAVAAAAGDGVLPIGVAAGASVPVLAIGVIATGALAVGVPAAGAAACFCCAAFSFSQAAKSSFERASTTIGMKP